MSSARAGRLSLLLLALCACGDDDALRSDAGPQPRCAVPAAFGQAPQDWSACGICIEPYARSIAPYTVGGSQEVQAIAVPGGLVVTMDSFTTLVTFVGVDGNVVPLPELARAGEEPPAAEHVHGYAYTLRVPDSELYWVVTNFDTTDVEGRFGLDNIAHVVLYERSDAGWRRLAAGQTGLLSPATALPTGELVGGTTRVDGSAYVTLVARDGEGTRTLEAGVEGSHDVLWPLADGAVAIIGTSGHTAMRDGMNVPVNESTLHVLDRDLEERLPPQRLTPPDSDPAYVVGEAPRPADFYVRPGGTARRAPARHPRGHGRGAVRALLDAARDAHWRAPIRRPRRVTESRRLSACVRDE